MDSSKSSPLEEEEQLASVRRRNTLLITVLFSLIISLSLIIGGFIIYLILDFNSPDPDPGPKPAATELCSATESKLSRVASISSSNKFKNTHYTEPIQIYERSLQSVVDDLSRIHSIFSTPDFDDDSRIHSATRNCSASIRVARGGLNATLASMRANRDVEMWIVVQRRVMAEQIWKAVVYLRSCGEDIERIATGSPAAVGEAAARMHEIVALLTSSRFYLLNCDLVKDEFRIRTILDSMMPRKTIIGRLVYPSGLWELYFVNIFLFVLLLGRCNLCCIRRFRNIA